MIILLHGPDTYRSQKKLEEIVERFKKTDSHGLNFTKFTADNFSFANFQQAVETLPFFGKKRLIVIENIISQCSKTLLEQISEYKKTTALEDVVIVFIEKGEIVKSNILFKTLVKIAKCQEFKLLATSQLSKWISQYFSRLGSQLNIDIKIGQGAIGKLASFIGPDLWRMENEANKLAMFKLQLGKIRAQKTSSIIIESKDIDFLVNAKLATNIFKTIDALATRDKKRAQHLIQEHLIGEGSDPLYLLAMFTYQFRNLLAIKDLVQKGLMFQDITRLSKLHPYVVKKSLNSARNFSLDYLKKIYEKLFELDWKTKTGQISPGLAIDLFVLEL